MIDKLWNYQNAFKIYCVIILLLFVLTASIFLRLLITNHEAIVIQESKIAGNLMKVSTRGAIQIEKPIKTLSREKEQEKTENKQIVIQQEEVVKQEQSQEEQSQEEVLVEEKKVLEQNKEEEREEVKEVEEAKQEALVEVTNYIQINQENKEEVQINDELVEHTNFGFETIGRIEIPVTGVDLPILSTVTVKGMEYAPCLLYATGEINKSGNNLIVGHNYRNNTLFSNNGKLTVGDKVYVTTLEGEKVEYTIYDKFITTPEEVNYLKREIGNEPEITLSCCADDDIGRIIILARANK